MSSHTRKIRRLEDAAKRDRDGIASDLSAARDGVRSWKRRLGPWLAALAAAAAGIGIAGFVSARRRRASPARSLLERARRSARGVRENRSRSLAATVLFALLRSAAVRRALVAGGSRLLAGGLGDEGSPEEGRAEKPRDKMEPADRTDGANGKDRTDRKASARPAGTDDAAEKDSKNRSAPSEEVGEQKAKHTFDELERAPWKTRGRFAWELFRDAFRKFQKDEGLTRAAALAYSTMLSLAPLLIIVVAVAGLVFDAEAVRGQILSQIEKLVGHDGARTIATLMAKASNPTSSVVAIVLGVATLLFGAGGVFGYLQQMMNKIWGVEEKAGGGLWTMIRSRFLSLAMVLGTGFLLLVSLVISASLSAIGRTAGGKASVVFSLLHTVLSWAIVAVLFALIFRFLPDTRIAWWDVWIGAGLTSLLFALGQVLIGLYLGRASVASVYGGAGSLVIVLLWTYYSGLILFYGAEVTRVFANEWGSRAAAGSGKRVQAGGSREARKPR